MPIIHSMSNSSTPEVDIRTAVIGTMFTYRFVNRLNTDKRKLIAASDDISAQELIGSDYIFAARFRWAV